MANYTSNFSGATIDAAINTASKIHFGTEKVETSGTSISTTVTVTTGGRNFRKIIPVVRVNDYGSIFTFVNVVALCPSDGVWRLFLYYCGANENTKLSGTYYIDWIGIEY